MFMRLDVNESYRFHITKKNNDLIDRIKIGIYFEYLPLRVEGGIEFASKKALPALCPNKYIIHFFLNSKKSSTFAAG
jgi:hypothetical protein